MTDRHRRTDRHVVIRADASATVGTGHVVRCQTLATALIARGWRATFATRALPDALADGLAEGGIGIVALAGESQMAGEPKEIADAIGRDATLVVADHYGVTAAWFDEVRRREPGAIVMAIDDLADRPLPVDMVLNQNLGASEDAYSGLVAPDARVLAGASYALLRPEFARLRGRDRDGRVERILVFMSGGDAEDVTARAAVAIGRVGLGADMVVGGAYPHLAALRATVAEQSTTQLHVNTGAMASLMDRADLAIGAPSAASWERCTLGLPAILVTMADNQVPAERHLVEAGAAVAIGPSASVSAIDIEVAIRTLSADPSRVAAMSAAAARVTDGEGTDRVVAEIQAIVARRS
jgi:UDP-2,4-diacetamido-2,4,6-trideoxy-beta-L-altropyranose hydrolase